MLEKQQAVVSGWAACWAVPCAGESSDAIRAIQTARAEQRNTAMLRCVRVQVVSQKLLPASGFRDPIWTDAALIRRC